MKWCLGSMCSTLSYNRPSLQKTSLGKKLAKRGWLSRQPVFGETIELMPEHQFHRIDAVRLIPLKIGP